MAIFKTVCGKWAIIVAIGLGISMIPCPAGVKIEGWRILAIFVATLAGFVLQPVPNGVLSLMVIAIIALLRIEPIDAILAGYGSPTIWLIACAFFLSKGFEKSGLGRRISLLFVRTIGTSSLKLGYALVCSDLFFAPGMPSITARSGAVIFPIINGICDVFESKPGPTARKIGSYLMIVENQCTCICSSMFLTAMASNPLAYALALAAGVDISWGDWAIFTIVPGLLSLAIVPYLVYKIYPPELTTTPEAPKMAREELTKMGSMSNNEKIQLGVFILCLGLWITGGVTKINATTVAVLGIGILLLAGVLDWKDCLNNIGAWDAFFWMAPVFTMGGLLGKYGVMKWLGAAIGTAIGGHSWPVTMFFVVLIYLYSGYTFASLTAHIAAFYPPMLALLLASGAPPMMSAVILAAFSSLCGALTQYSGAQGPVFYAAGYVDQGSWLKCGFINSLALVLIWGLSGIVWWKVTGYY